VTAAVTTPARSTAARRPALDRRVAMRMAAIEYDRVVAALRDLDPTDWSRPTPNAGWDVRAMAGHMLGMTHMAASLREQLSQMRAARRRGGLFIDALTAEQVERTAGFSTAELVDRFTTLGPRAARARRRAPGLLRGRTIPGPQPVDPPDGMETWTFGYLLDVILTRDPWMHRSDLAEATGRPMTLTADHDGVLVADVAAEWAERHGRPCTLTLTGPAGGSWTWGTGGESIELDAVEFCRILSGRGTGDGLLRTRVPF
jgi:uncharacterized protein (TIGR03083 family)